MRQVCWAYRTYLMGESVAEGAIDPHREQLRRFQDRRALQVELKQTVGVNVPIKERGQGPEVFRLEPRPESLPVDRPADLGSC